MNALEIRVYGQPAAQGSKRHVGNGVMIESSKKVKPWRQAVAWAAVEAMSRPDHLSDGPTFTGAVSLEVTFTLPKPKSAPKSRAFPAVKPDLDKLCRSTFDGLTDGGVWHDDSQVVRCIARKVYPGSCIGALATAGALIVVRQEPA